MLYAEETLLQKYIKTLDVLSNINTLDEKPRWEIRWKIKTEMLPW